MYPNSDTKNPQKKTTAAQINCYALVQRCSWDLVGWRHKKLIETLFNKHKIAFTSINQPSGRAVTQPSHLPWSSGDDFRLSLTPISAGDRATSIQPQAPVIINHEGERRDIVYFQVSIYV
ncbi:hypothetical protein N7457_000760 [Penicillium paradoxum]|uniref:uncharacterized protein n=1 Tax=Penicillium paradoxum TaxID=176176 RepID=UPI002548475C|nr:uncharacterized protein N7457_000760 [Penicillium paradoxum]KAJ5794161.1 hypothetical protein N7457_000760 [Penicillium paradoxum]